MTDPAAPFSEMLRNSRPGRRNADRIAEMLRVDHAGELGAIRIYQGQMAVFGRAPGKDRMRGLLGEMAAQERTHLDAFEQLLRERRVRPTALAPFWDVAGFGLGVATALISEEAAHACTAAVEEVISAHYGRQAAELAEDEPELSALVGRFGAEENEHRDTALQEGAERAPGYRLMSAAIRMGCRAAIGIAQKI